jgi:CheY-like chemotaxis protein
MAKILHVEDQRHWIDFTRKALADHEVDSAATFDDALEFLRAETDYDVALVDLNLVTQDDLLGGEILDLLRSQRPQTRRIVVTGSPPRGPLRARVFERYGVEEIIIKAEFTLPDLRKVVEEALVVGDIPQGVKLRRSELRQRLRDLQRSEGRVIDRSVREAEEYVRNAQKLSVQSGKRAKEALAGAESLSVLFSRECARIQRIVDSIQSETDALLAADEIERLQGIFIDQIRREESVDDERAGEHD